MVWVKSGGLHHNDRLSIYGFLIANPDGVLNWGQYHNYGDRERTIGDRYTTAAQAMGLSLEAFGVNSAGAMTEFLFFT